MESSICNKQIKELKTELHQANIYLKDIAQSLKMIANPDLRGDTWYIDNRPICNNNTREELSDDDLK